MLTLLWVGSAVTGFASLRLADVPRFRRSDPPTDAAALLAALVTRGIANEAKILPGAERTVRLRIHGIRVAHLRPKAAKGSASPNRLAQFWKECVGNTPLRLLAVGDDPAPESAARGTLLVFGPLRGTPRRALRAGILLRVLRDADQQATGLGATRHLALALARYDRSELPGLLVRGLLTTHTLTERFRRSPEWKDATAAVADLVDPPERLEPISEADVGVVCWMEIQPAGG